MASATIELDQYQELGSSADDPGGMMRVLAGPSVVKTMVGFGSKLSHGALRLDLGPAALVLFQQ